jgi:mannose-6-phosphate isomerase-like protein (cupin superfamily)
MASVEIAVDDLSASLAFYETHGFFVERIGPADAPTVAEIEGHGLRLRLVAVSPPSGPTSAVPLRLRRPCAAHESPAVLRAPEGTELALVPAAPPPGPVPAPAGRAAAVEVTHAGGSQFAPGRAGLEYRDLLPREHASGRWIASHIRIVDGGLTRDYVHWHAIRLQLIYVRRGWVRLAYEGHAAFTAVAGDCVLQPPRIRHKVIASSPGLEVVEVACPASHETTADRGMALHERDGDAAPAGDAAREWDGQRFSHHVAASSPAREPWRGGAAGFEARDLGVGAATRGLAGARVVVATAAGAGAAPARAHGGELCFLFVDEGAAELVCGDQAHALGPGDAALVPAGVPHALQRVSPDLRLLEVTLPGELPLA